MDNDELILSTLLEVKEDMGRFIAKCDAYDDHLEDHGVTTDKHDVRLRRLEIAVIPIYAAMLAAATWMADKISDLIYKHP